MGYPLTSGLFESRVGRGDHLSTSRVGRGCRVRGSDVSRRLKGYSRFRRTGRSGPQG